MKQGNKVGKILLLLCALMIAAVGCLEVSANEATETPTIHSTATASGRCTNVNLEGIEYYYPIDVPAADSDRWRSELEVKVTDYNTGTSAGKIVALQLDVIGSTSHYQCTQITPASNGSEATFSCNTIPGDATIKGVYFYYVPDVPEDTKFEVNISQLTTGKILNTVIAKVTYPPYPCSRNGEAKDFLAGNYALVWNTDEDCTSRNNDEIRFYESDVEPFVFANMIDGSLEADRFYFDVSPQVTYDYKLEIYFNTMGNDDKDSPNYTVTYVYDADTAAGTVDASELDTLTQSDLPLTLVGGKLSEISTDKVDLWGNPAYPTATDFTIKFYYANVEGTQGYENSSFHFTRYLDIMFAPFCELDNTSGNNIASGVASKDYNKCESTRQLFTVNLQDSNGYGVYVPGTTGYSCSNVAACTSVSNVYVEHNDEPSASKYYFATRKCADSSCSSWVTTTAYPYSITFSDGASTSRTYTVTSTEGKTLSLYKLKAWDATGHPFAIKEVRLMADEPGTYVIFAFVDRTEALANDLSEYALKFYLTINDSESISSCSTLGNNGYFQAYWNDCLDYRLTQLLTFSQIDGKETAWIENRSATGIHYKYYGERSYLPKKFELASLTCDWASVSGASGSVGYCNTTDIYVPAYTRVTVTGGTAYLESIPGDDMDYVWAFVREDTMSVMDLNIHVHTKECDNVKKIPDTGISLRSPLKVKESVKEDTNFVFTGNSLQIPAIGLGMEYPIPIVHVYYEEGADDRGWDLSTLGNYVGELEGGSYLPYAGNSALTGHYYSQGVFKNLENLNPGDEIIILGNDGIRYTYRVAQKFYAEEGDVYEMFQQIGERSLTLVTCDNYDFVTNEYSRRLLVRATIDHQEPYEMAE